MKYETLIACNDRKSKVYEPLPNTSSGVYNDSHYIACIDGHFTNSILCSATVCHNLQKMRKLYY